MKRVLCFLIFGILAAIGPLFAQDSAQADFKTLFESNDFVVLFSPEVRGDDIKRIELSQVFIVTPKFDLLTLVKAKISIEKRIGEPGGLGDTYWVHRNLVFLMYLTDGGNRPELFVVIGQDVAASVKEGFPRLVPHLRAVNNSLMVAEAINQIEDEKKFLEKVEPAFVFAQSLIKEAENFDVKKGLPKELIQQIPGYLNFDLAAWGLVPVPEEKE